MKNKNRRQILFEILSKSNLVMDGIVQLTMQLSSTKSEMTWNDAILLASDNLSSDIKNAEDYRSILIEQYKIATKNFEMQ